MNPLEKTRILRKTLEEDIHHTEALTQTITGKGLVSYNNLDELFKDLKSDEEIEPSENIKD